MTVRTTSAGVLLAAAWIVGLCTCEAGAYTISITYGDSAGEGFYDASEGAARRSAFEYATDVWEGWLSTASTGDADSLDITAYFDPLGAGRLGHRARN